jgi:hypothetical protein
MGDTEMGIYAADWHDNPAGYYADNKIKARHDSRVNDERRFSLFVENELGKMGYDRHDPTEIPTQSEIERAEKIARGKF